MQHSATVFGSATLFDSETLFGSAAARHASWRGCAPTSAEICNDWCASTRNLVREASPLGIWNSQAGIHSEE